MKLFCTPGTATGTRTPRDAPGRSREHPTPASSHTGPCGFYAGDEILLSHLQMGFWRSQSPTARSRSWKETSKSLSIDPTTFYSFLT